MTHISNDEIEEVWFQPGEYLFHEGEQSYQFYILQEGSVEVFKVGPKGEKISLAVISDGASIGEFAMIDRLPRSASACAITPVRANKISEFAYFNLLNELPEWSIAVMKTLVERIRHMNELVRKQEAITLQYRKQADQIEYEHLETIADSNPFLTIDAKENRDDA